LLGEPHGVMRAGKAVAYGNAVRDLQSGLPTCFVANFINRATNDIAVNIALAQLKRSGVFDVPAAVQRSRWRCDPRSQPWKNPHRLAA